MKRKLVYISLAMLLMLGLTAYAAAPTFDGSWKADVPRGNGRFIAATFDFGVEGNVLSGSVHAVDKEYPLVNGKVNGDEISFSVDGATGLFSGQLAGDEIKMKVKYDGGENGSKSMPFIAKRAKQ